MHHLGVNTATRSQENTHMIFHRSSLILPTAILGVLCGAPTKANAQTPLLDEGQGQQLSERLCSSCHDVTPDASAQVRKLVPSFQAIANKPAQTAERIVGALFITHPKMPTIPLTRVEVRNIVAYIQSLETNDSEENSSD